MKIPFLLVVDEDPDMTHLLVGVLESHGYEVTGAQSVAEATARITERMPDLLLLDLQLGDIWKRPLSSDGYDSLAIVRPLCAFQAAEMNKPPSR